MRKTLYAAALILASTVSQAVLAAEEVVVELTIKNHRFIPERLEAPAKTKIIVLVKNEDSEPEEFESIELHREKIVPGKSQARVVLGRLNPGEYPFVGEYHEATAKGVLVVK